MQLLKCYPLREITPGGLAPPGFDRLSQPLCGVVFSLGQGLWPCLFIARLGWQRDGFADHDPTASRLDKEGKVDFLPIWSGHINQCLVIVLGVSSDFADNPLRPFRYDKAANLPFTLAGW